MTKENEGEGTRDKSWYKVRGTLECHQNTFALRVKPRSRQSVDKQAKLVASGGRSGPRRDSENISDRHLRPLDETSDCERETARNTTSRRKITSNSVSDRAPCCK